ncbi:hypothetical protein CEXT_548211 [Caerostris extrusa]|uniref:Uncharacterized protein n=1 Tax=Caerostris extrusa TaxID=172846 RepID=A0AAV4WD23_CAEEX|nr:hypothetical protein CEXT_548211 [Caerostris extrusa]
MANSSRSITNQSRVLKPPGYFWQLSVSLPQNKKKKEIHKKKKEKKKEKERKKGKKNFLAMDLIESPCHLLPRRRVTYYVTMKDGKSAMVCSESGCGLLGDQRVKILRIK